MLSRYLSPLEVSRVLGCSTRTVSRMIAAGDLPTTVLSARLVRIDSEDLDAFTSARRMVRTPVANPESNSAS